MHVLATVRLLNTFNAMFFLRSVTAVSLNCFFVTRPHSAFQPLPFVPLGGAISYCLRIESRSSATRCPPSCWQVPSRTRHDPASSTAEQPARTLALDSKLEALGRLRPQARTARRPSAQHANSREQLTLSVVKGWQAVAPGSVINSRCLCSSLLPLGALSAGIAHLFACMLI